MKPIYCVTKPGCYHLDGCFHLSRRKLTPVLLCGHALTGSVEVDEVAQPLECPQWPQWCQVCLTKYQAGLARGAALQKAKAKKKAR